MLIEQATTLISHPLIAANSPMIWADLGCGSGLFTQALAQLLAPGSKIYALDKDLSDFRKIKESNEIEIEKLQADFVSDSVNISNLDGILMANSLHFVSDKAALINKWKASFTEKECYLVVEYDTDVPNAWVPYPVSFKSLKRLFLRLGYQSIEKIHESPSRYNQGNIYSVLINNNPVTF